MIYYIIINHCFDKFLDESQILLLWIFSSNTILKHMLNCLLYSTLSYMLTTKRGRTMEYQKKTRKSVNTIHKNTQNVKLGQNLNKIFKPFNKPQKHVTYKNKFISSIKYHLTMREKKTNNKIHIYIYIWWKQNETSLDDNINNTWFLPVYQIFQSLSIWETNMKKHLLDM